jgi:hypothetical protein
VIPWWLVLLAYAPLALTIVVVVVRLYGWITASWLTFDASAAASALAVPLLLGALHARSRDRHGVRTRVNKLTQQDALTGLLSATAFEEQLKGAGVGRHHAPGGRGRRGGGSGQPAGHPTGLWG